MRTATRAVIVGGVTTGKDVLEPTSLAIMDRYNYSDRAVFPLLDALNEPERLARAAQGQSVFVLSAGMMAVAECKGVRPERVWSFNSPEPNSTPTLTARAVAKTNKLWARAVTGPQREGAAKVALSNAKEATLHPVAYGRLIKAVSRFSTQAALNAMRTEGIHTARIDTEDCEFFGPHPLQRWDGNRIVVPGVHDELLIDPVGLLRQIKF